MPRMCFVAGFAGSQRLDERRRRRLANGTESIAAGAGRSSGRGDPLLRFFSSGGKDAACLTSQNCPLLTVIATQLWKHWLLAGGLLVTGWLLLALRELAPRWQPELGTQAIQALQTDRLITWFSQVVMLLTAQATAVVWWARSRSTKDFAGHYRIWGWATATWLVYGFCLTTGAHWVSSEIALHIVPWDVPGAALWCWALPACAWGWGIGLRLERDLSGCARSRGVFYLAALASLSGLLIQFQRALSPHLVSDQISLVALWSVVIFSQVGYLLSMTLHARHVLYFTAEPPRRPSAAAANPEAVPRVSFWSRCLNRFRRSPVDAASVEAEENADGSSKSKRKAPAKSKRKPATRKPSTRRKSAPAEEEEVTDDTEDGWEETTEEANEEWSSNDAATEESDEEVEWETADDEQPAAKNYRRDEAKVTLAAPHHATVDINEEDNEEDEGGGDPYQGMSKKQRRRMEQQKRGR